MAGEEKSSHEEGTRSDVGTRTGEEETEKSARALEAEAGLAARVQTETGGTWACQLALVTCSLSHPHPFAGSQPPRNTLVRSLCTMAALTHKHTARAPPPAFLTPSREALHSALAALQEREQLRRAIISDARMHGYAAVQGGSRSDARRRREGEAEDEWFAVDAGSSRANLDKNRCAGPLCCCAVSHSLAAHQSAPPRAGTATSSRTTARAASRHCAPRPAPSPRQTTSTRPSCASRTSASARTSSRDGGGSRRRCAALAPLPSSRRTSPPARTPAHAPPRHTGSHPSHRARLSLAPPLPTVFARVPRNGRGPPPTRQPRRAAHTPRRRAAAKVPPVLPCDGRRDGARAE